MWESFPQKLVSTDTISVDFHTESPVARRTSRQIDVIDSENRTPLVTAHVEGGDLGSAIFEMVRSVRDFALPPILKRDDLRLDFGRSLRFLAFWDHF